MIAGLDALGQDRKIMLDDDQADAAAAEILAAVLACSDRLTRAESKSHHVYLGTDVVLKLIGAGDHARLDREIALWSDLPPGLSAPVLASGTFAAAAGQVRYACVARLPGVSPGTRLVDVDRTTALRWAGQAIEKLELLHGWTPSPHAADVLRQPLDHGGFVGREQLLGAVREVGSYGALAARTLDGLTAIAEAAPPQASTTVPVHADCYWANWLVDDDVVTALLDFEWARFGEPADDWMFLARFSAEHMIAVLGLIAAETGTDVDALRAACEVREVSHVLADLLPELRVADRDPRAHHVAEHLVGQLDALVRDRLWWRLT